MQRTKLHASGKISKNKCDLMLKVSFAAYFNKITSVLNFTLFSGIVLLIAKDTCMVPAGFTLAKHSCHGTVPWVVLCQPQHVFSCTPPTVHNLPRLGNMEYRLNAEGLRKVQPVDHRSYSSHNNKRAQPALVQLAPYR